MKPIVDRRARDRAAANLRGFLSGRVTNFDFDDDMPETDDPAIAAIWSTAWCIYSDVSKHRLTGAHALPPSARREVLRWILFLDGACPYVWPPCPHPGFRHPNEAERALPLFCRKRRAEAFFSAGDYPAWPFATRAEEARAKRYPRRLGGRRKREPA